LVLLQHRSVVEGALAQGLDNPDDVGFDVHAVDTLLVELQPVESFLAGALAAAATVRDEAGGLQEAPVGVGVGCPIVQLVFKVSLEISAPVLTLALIDFVFFDPFVGRVEVLQERNVLLEGFVATEEEAYD